MKTSFYFVLWIIIYPLLGFLDSPAVNDNSFVIALIIVWGLSWLLNRSMPDILRYERFTRYAPVLEDIYTRNVNGLQKRLSRDARIETVTAIYFCVSTFALGISFFRSGVRDWFALAVFVFFTVGVISRSVKLVKAKAALSGNPTSEKCAEVADDTYNLKYASYYAVRKDSSYSSIFPERPAHYRIFLTVSLIFAILSVLLGLWYIIRGVYSLIAGHSIIYTAWAGMTFLYGSLATYFGLRDIISIRTTPS